MCIRDRIIEAARFNTRPRSVPESRAQAFCALVPLSMALSIMAGVAEYTLPIISPVEIIGKVYSATPAIIERAIESGTKAQKAWARLSGTERGRVLNRAASIIRERNYDLSVLETYDTGKPISETLYADATSAADALEYFGGLAGSITGEHIPLPDGNWAYTRREPLGLCVGIGAWNYPTCLLYTSPSPRDATLARMPSSA